MYRKQGRLDYKSSKRVANNGHSLQEWKRLYDRNPRAVPLEIQRTLRQRGLIHKGGGR